MGLFCPRSPIVSSRERLHQVPNCQLAILSGSVCHPSRSYSVSRGALKLPRHCHYSPLSSLSRFTCPTLSLCSSRRGDPSAPALSPPLSPKWSFGAVRPDYELHQVLPEVNDVSLGANHAKASPPSRNDVISPARARQENVSAWIAKIVPKGTFEKVQICHPKAPCSPDYPDVAKVGARRGSS